MDMSGGGDTSRRLSDRSGSSSAFATARVQRADDEFARRRIMGERLMGIGAERRRRPHCGPRPSETSRQAAIAIARGRGEESVGIDVEQEDRLDAARRASSTKPISFTVLKKRS